MAFRTISLHYDTCHDSYKERTVQGDHNFWTWESVASFRSATSLNYFQVQTLNRLLSRVKKTDMRRGVFDRNIEGLVQPTRSWTNFKGYASLLSDLSSWDSVLKFLDDRGECVQSLESIVTLFLNNLSSGLGFVDNALVSAIVLSIVFQYLVGYVDKGGTKTYNPGSLEFRATYVSLMLFLGAYVWIKFREFAQRTVWRRHKKDKFGKVLKDEFGQVQCYDKWEPRFKPSREKGFGKHNHLPLGGYDTHRDAEVVCQIAGFYYGKDEGAVALADGSHFYIPEMSEQERSLCGDEKRKWVSERARAVFREFKERAALSANAGEQADARGFSPPADQAVVACSTASDDEFAEFLLPSGLTHEHHDSAVQFDPDDLFNLDAGLALCKESLAPAMQESLHEQINPRRELLEAELSRRLAEHHRRLKEISELRQENKRLKTILQQAATPLRAFFGTSTVELESSTENC